MSDATKPVAGFDADIKPLFREQDRNAMLRSFDLWSYADVAAHAEQIAARLDDGTMPCDGPWPAEQVSTFADWISGGTQP
jgi:hypothetical protein